MKGRGGESEQRSITTVGRERRHREDAGKAVETAPAA